MIIYKIVNKINGMLYIGQTTRSLKERWRSHLKEKRQGRLIGKAIQKYGKDNFSIAEIDRYDNLDDLNNAEEYYIDFLNTLSPNGYNLLTGGKNGRHTEETKAKLSKIAMGRTAAFKGKHHTDETKALLRAAKLNKPRSNETKLKISAATKGCKNPFFGKTHSPETILKIKAARERDRGRKRGPYKKKVA